MKSKNELELGTLRMLRSSLKNKAIELIKPELTDDDVTAVLKTEIKKRKDAAETYRVGDRAELAEQEEAEIKVIEKYLPAQMDEAAIRAKAAEVIAGLSDDERANFGRAMGAVMKAMKGTADGTLVNQVVKELLQS